MSDLEARMRKGRDLQIRTGKPIALHLSAALGTAITSHGRSSGNLSRLPPGARGSCARRSLHALPFLTRSQQKAAAALPAAQSTGRNWAALPAVPGRAACGVVQREGDALTLPHG